MHSLYLNCARTTKYPAVVKAPMALPAILITSTGSRFAKMTENYENFVWLFYVILFKQPLK
jgi:hypothetical protein